MLAKRNQVKFKRILSTLLAVVMLLGLLPMGALAAGGWTPGTPRNQVAENNYDWENESAIKQASGKTLTIDGANIPAIGYPDERPFSGLTMTASKTATQAKDEGGKLVENLFDVNVTVTTNQSMDEMSSSGDTAVTLVVDLSGSMSDSISSLKTALNKFVNAYSNVGNVSAANAPKRMIHIVLFDDSIGLGINAWTDAATADGKAAVLTKIDTLTNRWGIYWDGVEYGGNTNIDGALEKANELIGENLAGKDGQSEIPAENRYVLLMTDGEPNKYSGKLSTSTGKVTYKQPEFKYGKWSTESAFEMDFTLKDNRKWLQPILRADSIREKAELYSIYFGNTNDRFSAGGKVISQRLWMSYFSDKFYLAGDTAELENMFQNFATIMTGRAEAWEYEDPMAQGVQFVQFNHSEDAVVNKRVEEKNGTISWNLKEDATFAPGDTNTYTLSYRVRLDNTALNGAVSAKEDSTTYYPLNNDTTLTYMFDKKGTDGTSYSSALGTAHLSVPAVEPLFGSLSFTKTGALDKGTNKPVALAGAKFALIESGKSHEYDNETGTLTTDGWSSGIVTSDASGAVSFDKIPSGHSYTLVELEAPAGYVTSAYKTPVTVSFGDVTVTKDGEGTPWTGDTFSNQVDPKNTEFTVNKTWLPSAPTGGCVTVEIYRVTGLDSTGEPTYDGKDPKATVTLKNDPWRDTVSLPTVDEYGESISYVARETGVTTGYAALDPVVKAVEDTFSFTNVRFGETESITLSKEWLAPVDAQTEVTLGLFRESGDSRAKAGPELVQMVTLNGNGGWSKNLGTQDRYDDVGSEYTYFVKEKNGNEWVSSGSITLNGNPFNVSVDGYTVTNTIQQTNSVTVSGAKTWVDGDNFGNIRPDSLEITLLADGEQVTIPANSADNTVGAGDTSYSFTGLPKYALPAAENDSDLAKAVIAALGEKQLDGHEIAYAVTDRDGSYTTTGGTAGDSYNLTNTRDDIGTTADVTVTKVWEDNGAYELRPTVKLELHRKANGGEDTGFTGYTCEFTQEGTTVTDEETGDTTVIHDNEQTYTFEDLEVYSADGYPYTYYAVEQGKDGNNTISGNDGAVYDVTENDLTVTNSLKGGSGETAITVEKAWVIPDGMERPEITVTLTGDNDETNVHQITLDGTADEDGETGAWTASFTGLPKYKDGGGLIQYTVTEIGAEGFTAVLSADTVTGGRVTITNTLDVEDQRYTVDVSGTKTWERSGSEDETSETTVQLQSDIGEGGSFADVQGKTAAMDGDTTTYSFTGLPQYVREGGKVREVQYRVVDAVTGYISEGGTKGENGEYDLTNRFDQSYTSISGTKYWRDDNAQRPDSIWVGLFRDGVRYGDPVEVTPAAAGVWSYTFGKDGSGANNLPEKKTVNETYTYEIRELTGADDDTGIAAAGSVTYGDYAYDVTYDGYDIYNTRAGDTDGRTRSFTASKIWQGPAAGEVTLALTQNGTTVSELTLTAADALAENANVWQGIFVDEGGSDAFPAFDGNGKAYTYNVTEVGAEQGAITLDARVYTVEIRQDGNVFTVINTVKQVNDVNVAVEKVWDFTGNVGASQPPVSIQIQLLADGMPSGDPVDLGTPWTYTFENLPRYNVSHAEINYTVAEVGEHNGAVQYGDDHYAVAYTENDDHVRIITNTYTATDLYTYRVQRVYTHYQDGVLDNTVSIGGTAERGVKDQLISADTLDTDAYKAADGKAAYSLTGSSDPITLSKPGTEYVITLNYELRETTPMSYYRVDRVYTHYLDGVQDGSVTITGAQQSAVTGTTIPAQDAEALKNQDGYGSYSYAGGNGALTLERAGETYVLTLTYELHDVTPPIPGEYAYRVDRVYTHYQDGVQDGSVTVAGGKTTGEENDIVLIGESDINGFKAADGRDGYTFVSGSPTIRTETPENPEGFEAVGVRLEQAGITYVITLSYELRDTTPPTPPTPPDPEVKTFDLTLHYYDKDSGRELTTVPFTMTGSEGSAWDVTDKAERQFYGYVFDSWEGYGDGLTGIFEDHDVTIDVFYVRDAEIPDEEVPDEPVPLGPQPNTPGDDGTDIGDNDVPLNPGPGGGDDDVTIEDGGVPLGNLPQTGFAAAPVNPAVTLGMLALSLSMAAAGLAITYTRKVKEEEE
ncbi:hypothetical protein CE91St41_37910 [Oscillospiraceae bacterium]|nr:hypothetical protein CE91St40_37890 [Oscillospiraceae bacterium]BDF76902.1 hypothetical protein CE91St41_37910 [Oscillospiraceae bacterium]